MSFVRTPFGTIMHADTHADLVEECMARRMKSMLQLLLPATPVDESIFGIDDDSIATFKKAIP
jgi:hypothetical protein